MKAIVTGGAGFLGKFVVERLRKETIEVVPCDVATKTGHQERHMDVTNRAEVDAIFGEIGPDLVVHLAALCGSTGKGGGTESVRNPFEYFRVNILGTLNVFESCRVNGIEKVIHMSSFSSYGVTDQALTEETPLNPNNPYGFSKACAEDVAKCYALNYGIKTVIFRAPLLCGEGQRELNALREFVMAVRRGEPIVVLGEGRHVREWIHPFDVADAFALAIPYLKGMNAPYEILVLGNAPISMKDLADLVIKTTGKKTRVEHAESTKQLFDQFTDASKAKRLLGWQPKIPIQEIVKRVAKDILNEQ